MHHQDDNAASNQTGLALLSKVKRYRRVHLRAIEAVRAAVLRRKKKATLQAKKRASRAS